MKQKTLRRILKRFQRLPLHHIDTSVILESETTENGQHCRKYLQKVGYNYMGKLSFPVLSELFVIVLKLENYVDKRDLFDTIDTMISARKMIFYSPEDICRITGKIKEIDTRIEKTDREIIACAIEDKAAVLVTLDKDLIHNERIENIFGIRIRHPKELL